MVFYHKISSSNKTQQWCLLDQQNTKEMENANKLKEKKKKKQKKIKHERGREKGYNIIFKKFRWKTRLWKVPHLKIQALCIQKHKTFQANVSLYF